MVLGLSIKKKLYEIKFCLPYVKELDNTAIVFIKRVCFY